MNTFVDNAPNSMSQGQRGHVQLPAGAGLALAVLLGSVMWLGIFAIVMI